MVDGNAGATVVLTDTTTGTVAVLLQTEAVHYPGFGQNRDFGRCIIAVIPLTNTGIA